MEFTDGIANLVKRIRDMASAIETEEATKNALIMPFIRDVLGYDVFDPSEVIPEYTADVGLKRGEKVDYAILKDGKVQILMECKKLGDSLDTRHASQLFRYFAVAEARIGILTNGQEYHVFTDADMPNIMDKRPFLVFDLLDIDRTMVPEIQKLSKADFDLESVVSAAEELKYISGVRKIIAGEAKEPSDEWIRFFVKRLYERSVTAKVIDQFRPLVTRALNQYIGDQVQGRLKTALDDGDVPAVPMQPGVAAPAVEVPTALAPLVSDVETTEEELQGFNIVRAIAAAEVNPERVVYRDGKAYFAVLLDDNNRKPLIRLHLNSKNKKFVTTFEAGKDGTRRDVSSVVDIYRAAGEAIKATIRHYETGKVQAEPE